MALVERMVTAARALSWYITSLMGDRAYDVYVAHLALEHPGRVPVPERQYWRERYREQDEKPGARCC